MSTNMLRATAFIGVLSCLLVSGAPARAADDPMACVAEAQRICVQMEDRIEDCIATRRTSFSAACIQQLTTIMGMVEQKSGPGACVEDVKRACAAATGAALQSCITAKRATFSLACQRVLGPTN